MTERKRAVMRKCISIVLGIMMAVAFMPVSSMRAHAATALTQTSGDIAGGEYELTKDINTTGTLTIPAGTEVTIDLKDHDIWNSKNHVTFDVLGTLILRDTVSGNKYKGQVSGTTGCRTIVIEDGGKFELQSGTVGRVVGSTPSQGVEVRSGGTFTMSGGSVKGHTYNDKTGTGSALGGVGVFVDSGGTFDMSGGEITNNHCNDGGAPGGGVMNYGRFDMSGGSIYANEAGYGGGVCNDKTGEMDMTGGTIAKNMARQGGGVYNRAAFTMNGGTISSNYGKNLTTNSSYNAGAGVYNYGSGSFTMTSGKIIRNYGVSQGGGVWAGGTRFDLQGGTISGNTAYKAGGGIYYVDQAKNKVTEMAVSGAPIVKGNIIIPDDTTEQADDLYLFFSSLIDKHFTLGDLEQGAEIGVFKDGTDDVIPISKAVTDTSKLEPSAQCFFSNRDEYIVAADQDQKCLVLRKPATFTVSFDTDGGSTVASQSVKERSKAARPEDPTKDGKTFDGWYTDGGFTTKYDFDTPVTADLTLYAKWKDKDSGSSGGSGGGTTIVYPQDPQPGTTVTIIPKPKEGYDVEEVIVNDSSGGTIDVTKNDDGSYTFVQPRGNVTIYVNYVKRDSAKPMKRAQILNLKAVPAGKRTERLTWTKVDGAKGYDVYFAKCGNDLKKIRSTKARTLRKTRLKKGTIYKYRVRAYKIRNGKKVYIASSYISHAIAGGYNSRYTDAKSIRAAKKSITLKVGRTARVRATQKKLKRGRKFIRTYHASIFRFRSTDKSVATVNKYGRVTAKKAGTCTIYIYAQNGMWTRTKITVK